MDINSESDHDRIYDDSVQIMMILQLIIQVLVCQINLIRKENIGLDISFMMKLQIILIKQLNFKD